MFAVGPRWCFRVKASPYQFTRGDPNAQIEITDSFQPGLQPETGELRGQCPCVSREYKLQLACVDNATPQSALKYRFLWGSQTHLLQWLPGVAGAFGKHFPACAAAAALLKVPAG